MFLASGVKALERMSEYHCFYSANFTVSWTESFDGCWVHGKDDSV